MRARSRREEGSRACEGERGGGERVRGRGGRGAERGLACLFVAEPYCGEGGGEEPHARGKLRHNGTAERQWGREEGGEIKGWVWAEGGLGEGGLRRARTCATLVRSRQSTDRG